MAKRQKNELSHTLKASDFKKPVKGVISKIEDIDTKYGEKTILTFTVEGDEKPYSVFLNADSQNNLIDAFGDDDENWLNKPIEIKKEKDETFEKDKLVVYPGK